MSAQKTIALEKHKEMRIESKINVSTNRLADSISFAKK